MAKSCITEAESLPCKVAMLSRDIGACAARLLKPHGVTPSQAQLMYFVREGLDSPSLIARKMGVDASNLSRIIRALEKRGWIQRLVDDENRTRVRLTLTDKGEAVSPALNEHAEIIQEVFCKTLSEQELKTFTDNLIRLSVAINETQLEPMDGSLD